MSKKIRILSIDGGGIRGIMPGTVLVSLEKKLQKKTGNPDVRLADYFDFISGTSTGGILACTYLIPDGATGKPKYSASDAVSIYLDRGDEIFDVSFWQKVRTKGGLTDEKFSAKALEDAFEEYYGDTRLSELLKPCLITSYDIRNRKAHFFKQHNAKNSEARDYLVKDVARATSAAPTYFETASVKSILGAVYPLIDGGVFVNNPAMCAYAEVKTMKFSDELDKPRAKDMFILSMGTGSVDKSYYYKEVKDWGVVGWIKPLIDIMMSGNSETVDYQLKQLFNSDGNNDGYIRIEPGFGTASHEMDCATQENLKALHEAGLECAADHDEQLDKIAETLIANEMQLAG